jgi:hypothetical protein
LFRTELHAAITLADFGRRPSLPPARLAADAATKARGKHYQLACALAFEGISGVPHDTGINRPSDYYVASVEAAAPKAAAGAPAPAAGQQQRQAGDGGGATPAGRGAGAFGTPVGPTPGTAAGGGAGFGTPLAAPRF